jgi:hypothetical protein
MVQINHFRHYLWKWYKWLMFSGEKGGEEFGDVGRQFRGLEYSYSLSSCYSSFYSFMIQQLTLPVIYLSITCSLTTLATHRDQLITVVYSISRSSINSLLFSSSSIYSFMNLVAFFPILSHPSNNWVTNLTYCSHTLPLPLSISKSLIHLLVLTLSFTRSLTRTYPVLFSVTYLYLPWPLLGHLLVLTLSFTRSLTRTYSVLY